MKNIQKHIAMHKEKISLYGVHVIDLEVPFNPNGRGEPYLVEIWGKERKIYFRKHLYLFPNRLEIGVDSDPHVWPLEEIIGIQENVHRSYRCIQIRLVKDHKRSPNYFPIIGIIVNRFIYSNFEYFEF